MKYKIFVTQGMNFYKYLGPFSKLRKATINFVMSVCLFASLSVWLAGWLAGFLSVHPRGTTRHQLEGFS
jgi:hypothetical protein